MRLSADLCPLISDVCFQRFSFSAFENVPLVLAKAASFWDN